MFIQERRGNVCIFPQFLMFLQPVRARNIFFIMHNQLQPLLIKIIYCMTTWSSTGLLEFGFRIVWWVISCLGQSLWRQSLHFFGTHSAGSKDERVWKSVNKCHAYTYRQRQHWRLKISTFFFPEMLTCEKTPTLQPTLSPSWVKL